MASELAIAGVTTGSTVVAQIRRDTDEEIWSVTGSAYEVFSSAHQTTGNYDVVLTEQGSSGYFVGDMPALITDSGLYNISFYVRTGSNPYTYSFQTAGTITFNYNDSSATPTGLNYITRDDYKTFADITDTSLDSKIDLFLPMAAVMCNNYVGRALKQTNFSKVYNCHNTSFVALGEYPVASVTNVTFGYTDSNPTTVNGSEFYVNDVGTVRFNYNSAYRQGFCGRVKVAFVAGYSSIPQDLKMANLLVLDALIKQADPDYLVAEKVVGNVKIKYDIAGSENPTDPIFAKAQLILDGYKQPVCI